MGSFDRGVLTYQSIIARVGSTGGHVNLSAGTNTLSGYAEFYSSKGIRQGYIGKSSTTATADAGTIPYVAGTHAFSGAMTVSSNLNVTGSVFGTICYGYTNPSSGYAGVVTGNASNTGYVGFFAANSVRQGYIGFSSSTATADAGTIPYIAGTHAFTGTISAGIIATSNYIHVNTSTGTAFVYIQANAGIGKYLVFRTGSLNRWLGGSDTGAESGANAGSDFFLNRYDDAGAYISTPFIISRATGNVTFSHNVTAARFIGPADTLFTPRTINGISFNGSANIGVDYRVQDYGIVAGTVVHGGGTITLDSSSYLLWSARFLAISSGRNALTAAGGYFDITCPTSGTITGVGGAASVTATAAGIPLNSWQSLYYILPVGSGSASVAANFRIVSYTSDIDIPSTWLKIAHYNGDGPSLKLVSGQVLSPGQSLNNYTQDSYAAVLSYGLKSATTTVSVSAATAPSSGQVLTATSSTTATWQTPSGGSVPDFLLINAGIY